MRTIILIGTSHAYQLSPKGDSDPSNEEFRNYVTGLCQLHKVRAISEEMNIVAMNGSNAAGSIAKQVCTDLGLFHRFSDPCPKERRMLGVRDDNGIKAEGWLKKWSPNKIQDQIEKFGSDASDRVREREWFRRIEEIGVWPVLFICGSNHVASFSSLLHEHGISVIEAAADWEANKK